MPSILYTQEVNKDIKKLSNAWSEPETFVLLSERSGVSRSWIEEALINLPQRLKTDHFALLTSGSTGQPKLVVGSRKRAEELVRLIHRFQEAESAEETILALPLSYCYAFVNQWLWARVFNRRFIYTSGCSHPDLLREALLKANKAMLCLVASQIPLFIRHFGEVITFNGVIRLNFAGGPFPQNDIDIIHRFFPSAKVFNNYGCTEAMPRLTIRAQGDSQEGSNVGRPLPGIKMKTDRGGRVIFNSPYSAVGFYDNNGFSLLSQDMWISTQDLGEKDDSGCWFIKGRVDEVFKRFGEKIAIPQLLKTVYLHWPGEATFYKENDSSGENHVLILCPEPTQEQYRAILYAFRQKHPRTHWPVRLESTDSFPLLDNGKINKFALASKVNKTVHWYQRI